MDRINEIKVELFDNSRKISALQQKQRDLGIELAELESKQKEGNK